MSIIVMTDTPIERPCRDCGGEGWEVVRNHWGPPERDYCSSCGGPGLDFIDLACLALNFAVAGALCAAWGYGLHGKSWWPGCQDPMPGWPAPELEDAHG